MKIIDVAKIFFSIFILIPTHITYDGPALNANLFSFFSFIKQSTYRDSCMKRYDINIILNDIQVQMIDLNVNIY